VAGVLERSQQLGFLGPGPVSGHIRHAVGFAGGLDAPAHRLLDLGSGGGVPGLVLATVAWPESTTVLLDSGLRRCVFLEEAVEELGLHERVSVRRDRAEIAGRDLELRGTFDVVVSRSFGSPAVTAECAAPFLCEGGVLVVSEPPPASVPAAVPWSASASGPDAGDEAPEPGVEEAPEPGVGEAPEPVTPREVGVELAGDDQAEETAPRRGERWPDAGLAVLGLERGAAWASPFHYQALVQRRLCPGRFPRRVGIPAKRPLF